MLVLEAVTKTFGDKKVVDSLSLEVKKGEILGLLGPNGAGKTTTMRLITGYYLPESGSIFIGGVNSARNPEYTKRHIGYLAENNPLYTEMLVFEYLEFVGNLRGIDSETLQSEIINLSKETGLSEMMISPIKSLSKGYKQRVGLTAALLGSPDVLILDEPTEGLDPIQRIELSNLIKKLPSDRHIILSTHVLQEVEETCTRAVIINGGKKVYEGIVTKSGELAKFFQSLKK